MNTSKPVVTITPSVATPVEQPTESVPVFIGYVGLQEDTMDPWELYLLARGLK